MLARGSGRSAASGRRPRARHPRYPLRRRELDAVGGAEIAERVVRGDHLAPRRRHLGDLGRAPGVERGDLAVRYCCVGGMVVGGVGRIGAGQRALDVLDVELCRSPGPARHGDRSRWCRPRPSRAAPRPGWRPPPGPVAGRRISRSSQPSRPEAVDDDQVGAGQRPGVGRAGLEGVGVAIRADQLGQRDVRRRRPSRTISPRIEIVVDHLTSPRPGPAERAGGRRGRWPAAGHDDAWRFSGCGSGFEADAGAQARESMPPWGPTGPTAA